MTSKISYFDGALFRRSLKKTLPLWVCYFLLWLFLLPGNLLSFDYAQAATRTWQSLPKAVFDLIMPFSTAGLLLSAVIGLLSAWLLFSWLFRASTSNFYAALPVRRETLFFSNLSVGLVMVTLVNLFIALCSFLITVSHGCPMFIPCMAVFAVSTLSFLGFYGFAVFLSVVIGQSAAMPAVYVILNFASAIVYYAVEALNETFVYGMNVWWEDRYSSFFYKLSPIYYIGVSGYSIWPTHFAESVDGKYWFSYDGGAIAYVLALAGAGIVLTVLALLLFRHREMERSGDVIAVRALRPVFLFCFSLGCGVVFAWFVSSMQSTSLYGAAAYRRTLLYLALGAFFGYFAAQMLLKKSVHVFRGAKIWTGFGAVCLVLLLTCTAFRYDVLGLYTSIPALQDVNYVDVNSTTVSGEETIAAIADFQRLALERRKENEAETRNDWTSVTITYTLKDSTRRSYRYRLADGAAQQLDEDSLICRFDKLYNTEAMILSREAIPEDFVDAGLFVYGSIDASVQKTAGGADLPRILSAEEAYTFYTTCVLPDLKDGLLGVERFCTPTKTEEADGTESITIPVTIVIEPTEEAISRYDENAPGPSSFSTSYWYRITKEARRSAAFLESLGYSFDGPLG